MHTTVVNHNDQGLGESAATHVDALTHTEAMAALLQSHNSDPSPRASVLPRQVVRWILPVSLVLLILSTLLWLPWQAQHTEATERQEQLIADTLWVEQTVRFQLSRDEQSLQLVASEITAESLSPKKWHERVQVLRRNSREMQRIVWLDADGKQVASTDEISFDVANLSTQAQLALQRARQSHAPQYSQPVPQRGNVTPPAMDYLLPMFRGGRYTGALVATYSIPTVLDEMIPWWFAQDNEIALTDEDDNVIDSRASGGPGRGVYVHSHPLDLPGVNLLLRTNSVKSAPRLLPNLLVGSVIALSLGLLWSLAALWRDINRRLATEDALRKQVAFRSAMEDSLITGLRARDLEGRITYVNPAFCEMVGRPAVELVGSVPPMPYWAPEAMEQYQERFSRILAGNITPQFETTFLRANGERFPVLVFESPLLDHEGTQTGWMGSILDVSERKRIEDLNRQQQEKLQASARLASMGELASTLAHELNQPLAAISSYTTGALNLLASQANAPGPVDASILRAALEKANTQAQRAGHIIRSVHAFVKKREPTREPVSIRAVLDSLLPLIELQARPHFVTVQVNVSRALPPVLADRVMLEQVLLNLTRNGIESMQEVAPEQRLLRITAATDSKLAPNGVLISVVDRGHGISPAVAERLFSPFFSTKAEGMGMGLNICRSMVEFHGGTLTHEPNRQSGTIFRFVLPMQTAQDRLEPGATVA
jgi:two-component system sensor histidine kinase DctS